MVGYRIFFSLFSDAPPPEEKSCIVKKPYSCGSFFCHRDENEFARITATVSVDSLKRLLFEKTLYNANFDADSWCERDALQFEHLAMRIREGIKRNARHEKRNKS